MHIDLKTAACWLAPAVLLCLSLVMPARAVTDTSFTYQGELRLSGAPIAGAHDFRFRLYTAEVGGSQQGSQLTLAAVPVVDGVFTVTLDFGAAAFSSQPRWLEIDVRDSSLGGSYETLSPRTPLTSVPYARAAGLAMPGAVNAASIQAGSVGTSQINAGQVQRRVVGSCSGGQSISQVNQDGSVVCVAGGSGAGWSLSGNSGTSPTTNFLGTTDSVPLVLRANDRRAAFFESVDTAQGPTANVILGSPENFIRAGVRGATISGGGAEDNVALDFRAANRVLSDWGTVAGGFGNTAGSDSSPGASLFPTVGGGWNNVAGREYATVGGGFDNIARGSFSAIIGGENNRVEDAHGVVAGGLDNQVLGPTGTVGGGNSNFSTELGATVAGGIFNTASHRSSMVAGGESNCAGGSFSFAGGRRAKIRPGAGSGLPGFACNGVASAPASSGDQGTFMWADAQNSNFISTGQNQFLVRAAGGVFFGTDNAVNLSPTRFISTSTGAHLTFGGTWTNSSSRYLKSAFETVDVDVILRGVLDLPISRWIYRDSPDEGKHLGPMAEDFHATFGLGDDASAISTVDASGVALAAIQGLNQRLEAENRALREHNARQDEQMHLLRDELAELRRLIEAQSDQ